jgi:site-specific recombinase XerD
VLRGTIRINEGLAEPCTLSHSSRFGEPFNLATSDLQRNRRHVIHELPTPFDPMLKKAQLPPIRLHDLMHACATILLKAGEYPKFVQELLDHASINITLDTYSHIMEGWTEG